MHGGIGSSIAHKPVALVDRNWVLAAPPGDDRGPGTERLYIYTPDISCGVSESISDALSFFSMSEGDMESVLGSSVYKAARHILVRFDDLGDTCNSCKTMARFYDDIHKDIPSDMRGGGFADVAAALRARMNDAERINHIKEVADSIELEVMSDMELVESPEYSYGIDEGDDLDEFAVLARDPEPWNGYQCNIVPTEVMRIGVNLASNHLMGRDDYIWRVAAALAAASVASSLGFNVEVVAIIVNSNLYFVGGGGALDGFRAVLDREHAEILSGSVTKFMFVKRIKAATDPIEYGSALAALCDISYHRIIDHLNMITRRPELPSAYRLSGQLLHKGLGYPALTPSWVIDQFDLFLDYTIDSRGSAVSHVLDWVGTVAARERMGR